VDRQSNLSLYGYAAAIEHEWSCVVPLRVRLKSPVTQTFVLYAGECIYGKTCVQTDDKAHILHNCVGLTQALVNNEIIINIHTSGNLSFVMASGGDVAIELEEV